MKPPELLVFDFEHGAPVYTTQEVCALCEIELMQVARFVESGILKPEGAGPADWRFPPHAIILTRRAAGLQKELQLELPGLTLMMELIEEISTLRRQVERLRSQLACFTPET